MGDPMNEYSKPGFERELRISAQVVICLLVCAGVMLWYIGEDLPAWPQIEMFVLVLLVASMIAWLLHAWRPQGCSVLLDSDVIQDSIQFHTIPEQLHTRVFDTVGSENVESKAA